MRLPASALGLAAIAVSLVACGGPATGPDAAPVDGPPADAGGPDEPGLAPCELSVDSPTRVTYYVAINQPGADNEACDGLAPTDEGGGHCPFRDFTSLRVRELLYLAPDFSFGVRGVTVLVREGTYQIEPIEAFPGEPPIPLWIYGAGDRAEDAVVLAAYPGERPVLDGTCDEPRPECQRPEDPNRLGTLLHLWGRWERLEGMTIANVHHWNVTVSGEDTCIQDNELIGPHGSDSDSIKSFDGSGPNVVVRRNDLHGFAEQLIDATSSTDWMVIDNDFHDAGKGVGFKFEARGSVVRGNRFWNLQREAVSFGAAGSSDHALAYEAFDLVAEQNHIRDTGMAIQFSYCNGCIFRDNLVDRAVVGVMAIDQGPSGCAGGCSPTTGMVIEGNVFRDLTGNAEAPPDLFVAVDPVVIADFTAADNVYCLAAGRTDAFYYGGAVTELLRFPTWVQRTATDTTSRVADRGSAECGIATPPAP